MGIERIEKRERRIQTKLPFCIIHSAFRISHCAVRMWRVSIRYNSFHAPAAPVISLGLVFRSLSHLDRGRLHDLGLVQPAATAQERRPAKSARSMEA